jgi:hypothetical protein
MHVPLFVMQPVWKHTEPGAQSAEVSQGVIVAGSQSPRLVQTQPSAGSNVSPHEQGDWQKHCGGSPGQFN